MGSLTSTPKPKPVVETVFVPQPTAQPQVSEEEREQEAAEQQAEERRDNLLRRSRGRSGTVTTGFRGLLNLSNTQTQGKTLLGE